ncbi:MAG: dephospho-CoA kinase [Gammaproteobacteria bacterium]|nr:dephospho-CoA kinase [Gammaproteobacteria bacterium]
MLTIGLTGGIGSGKSAASNQLEHLGVPVIDADLTAREVVMPGEPALELITQRFGAEILNPDGTINRSRLRALVFQDSQARRDLEGILHPRIRQRMKDRLSRLSSAYAVLSIPLLVETHQVDSVDRVLVVDCPEAVQIQRIQARDHATKDQARAILAAQCDRQTRLRAADDIIDNSGDLEQLKAQVVALHARYLDMAKQLKSTS